MDTFNEEQIFTLVIWHSQSESYKKHQDYTVIPKAVYNPNARLNIHGVPIQ